MGTEIFEWGNPLISVVDRLADWCNKYEDKHGMTVEDKVCLDLIEGLGKVDLPDIEWVVNNDAEKWPVVSMLQKAIRRGEVDLAVSAALAMYSYDRMYLWKRMAIIAYEDIGVANPLLCAAVANLSGKDTLRKVDGAGGTWVTAEVARIMAESVKDRTICHMSCAVGADAYWRGQWEEFKKKYHQSGFLAETWYDKYADPDLYWKDRLYAGMMLTRGFVGYKEKPFTPMCSTMIETRGCGLPIGSVPHAMLRMGLRKSVEGLNTPIPIVWGGLSSGAVVSEMVLPETVMIGKVPGYAFDKHTQQGKMAIAQFARVSKGVNRWCQEVGFIGNRASLIGVVLFIVEAGNVVKKFLDYPLYRETVEAEMKVEASLFRISVEQLESLCSIVLGDLPQLNSIRERVVNNG